MSLTLVTGSANSGKSGLAYGIVRDALGARLEPVIVVPTAPDALRARLEFGRSSVMGVRIQPAATFIQERWSLWGDGSTIVTADQRRLTVRETLQNTTLDVLGASADSPGFPSFVESIAIALSPWELGELDSPWPVDREILKILAAYRGRLSLAHLMEQGEAWRRLGESHVTYPGPVVFHRFVTIDPGIERFIVGCAALNEVALSLTWVEGRQATRAVGPQVERLRELADRHAVMGDSAISALSGLRSVERNLMEGADQVPSDGAVTFAEATGVEAELALVASQARTLADDEGIGPGGVAIVYRTVGDRAAPLARMLTTHNLPFDLDIVEPVVSVPLGAALLQLLEGVNRSGDARSLSAFLATPFTPLRRGDREALDERWRRQRTQSAARLTADIGRACPEAEEAPELARRILETGLGIEGLADWKRTLDLLLKARHGALSDGSRFGLERDAAAHRAAYAAGESLLDAAAGHPVVASDLIEAVRGATTTGNDFDRPGRVQVVEAHRLGARRFKAVIIAGLDDVGFAPGRGRRAGEDAIESMAPVAPTDGKDMERLLFYNAATRASERLVLVRQSEDSDGKVLRPSPFWDEMLDLYRDPGSDSELPEGLFEEPMGPAQVLDVTPAIGRGRRDLRRRAVTDGVGRPVPKTRGVLADPATLDALATRDEFSVTELQDYAKCPYQWFYKRMVSPEGLDAEFGPLEAGNFVHAVLHRFYSEEMPRKLGTRRVDDANLEAALEVIERLRLEMLAHPDAPQPLKLAERVALDNSGRMLQWLVVDDASMPAGSAPLELEWSFGSATHPVTIGDFGIRGRIDRIDEGGGVVAVMDYKTGRLPESADIDRDREIQVMLYAHAVERALGLKATSGLYRGLKTEQNLVRSPGELRAYAEDDGSEVQVTRLEAAVRTARRAADGIRAGLIPCRPVIGGVCKYCPAAGVCQKEPGDE